MHTRRAGVYVVRCLPTGQAYVGSSLHVGRRLLQHRALLRAGIHPNTALQAAWRAHGEESFSFEVAATGLREDELRAAEERLIGELREASAGGCFNGEARRARMARGRGVEGAVRDGAIGASAMTLDQLETFVQVARARSFSRAAVLRDLAQPTLSGRIAVLEGELGAPLFVRHGHTLELTDAGRALLPYAERMLALRSEGRHAVQRVHRGGLGRLALGANPTTSQYLMPRLIEAFWRAHPAVQVTVRTALSAVLMEGLLDGAIQLALCSRAQLHPRAQVLWSYSDPLWLVAAKDHPLGRRRECERADLAEHAILSTQAGPTHLGLRHVLPPNGDVPIALEATAGEVLTQLLLRGVGVTVLPSLAIWDELQRGDLVQVRVRDAELPDYEVALAQWPGRDLTAAAEPFAGLVRAIQVEALLSGRV
jgi:DNA-binding transcriptional LysR family regulator